VFNNPWPAFAIDHLKREVWEDFMHTDREAHLHLLCHGNGGVGGRV
jgi:hypothetical protein